MSEEIYDATAIDAQAPQHPRWYRRRGPRSVVAGVAAVGIGVAGVVGIALAKDVEPKMAIADAIGTLKEDTTAAVTITSTKEEGKITLTRVDDAVHVTVESADGTLDAAVIDEQLYLRMTNMDLGDIQNSPEFEGFLALFPSLSAIIDGNWVSVDLSEDSPVMTELTQQQQASGENQEAAQQAADQFLASVKTIGEQLRGPLGDALEDNVTITEVDNSTGPKGSDQYHVTLDAEAASDSAEATLRQAADDLFAAVRTAAAASGAEDLTTDVADLDKSIAEAQAQLDAFFAEDLEQVDADVWIQNGSFTQITFEDATLTFDDNPALPDVTAAVSLDDDLVRLLDFVEQMGYQS